MNIHWVEIAGYIAAILVFSTFYMKTMIPLRVIGICSNIAFLVYGWLGALYPVMILHTLLLPLNTYRLFQLKNLIKDIRDASQANFSMEWLIPYATKKRFIKDHVLFNKGDISDSMFYIVKGIVRIKESNLLLKEGDIIGEIGLFTPNKLRTATLICETDIEILVVSEQKIMQLYYQNPKIGFYLTRLIVGRLLENQQLNQKTAVVDQSIS